MSTNSQTLYTHRNLIHTILIFFSYCKSRYFKTLKFINNHDKEILGDFLEPIRILKNWKFYKKFYHKPYWYVYISFSQTCVVENEKQLIIIIDRRVILLCK